MRFPVSERESHKETLVHLLLAFRHRLQRLLFLMHLLILGHVGLIAEVVKVARVGLRVQLGDKGSARLAEAGPVYLGKVVVREYVLNIGETAGAGLDAAVRVLAVSP